MVDRDVVTAKIATIDRCLDRITETRGERSAVLLPIEIEDIVVLNLQRAVQATIDLATHVVTAEGHGLPDSIAAFFTALEERGIVDPGLAERLRRMVGFRNIADPEGRHTAGALAASICSEAAVSPARISCEAPRRHTSILGASGLVDQGVAGALPVSMTRISTLLRLRLRRCPCRSRHRLDTGGAALVQEDTKRDRSRGPEWMEGRMRQGVDRSSAGQRPTGRWPFSFFIVQEGVHARSSGPHPAPVGVERGVPAAS